MKHWIACLISVVWISCKSSSGDPAPGTTGWPQALKMADYILSLQNTSGAIEDVPGWGTVNEDSNMEYALIALAAAYDRTRQTKYLTGLENGIVWLAEREEISDPTFKGSWWYAYDPNGNHLAVPPGTGYADARGVDTTSALFVYLLYLDKRVNPASTLPTTFKANALAALDYLQNVAMDTDGCTWSSWLLTIGGTYERYAYKYTADQGDVWLGLHAGAILYDAPQYGPLADALRNRVESAFFSSSYGRYSLGMDEAGTLDWSLEDFGPIQCQGWLPWAWGPSTTNTASVTWLASKVQTDGSLKCYPADPRFSLSAACLGLGKIGLGQTEPLTTLQWLTSPLVFDSSTGGVKDSVTDQMEPCNNAGLCAVALIGWPAFAER